jgi:hypothetical protein
LLLNAASYTGGVFYSADLPGFVRFFGCFIIGDCGLPYGGFGIFY